MIFSTETWNDLTWSPTRLAYLAAFQTTYASLQSLSWRKTGFTLADADNAASRDVRSRFKFQRHLRRGNCGNCATNLLQILHSCFFSSALFWPPTSGSFTLGTCGFVFEFDWPVMVCAASQLMCHKSYHFPLRLGRHAGVTVHQGLGRLWERVGDAVTETLTQTGSVRRTERIIAWFNRTVGAFMPEKARAVHVW